MTNVPCSPPAATATDKDDQRYEEMMERFQIRRLQPTGTEESGNASQRDFRRGSGSAIYHPSQGDPQGDDAPFESRSSLPDFSGRSLSRSPSKYGRLRGSLLDTRATAIEMSSAVKAPQVSPDDEGTATMSRLENLYHEGTSPDFQKQLMLNLLVRVYLPDDYVIRRGEVDEEFYMINRRGAVNMAGNDDLHRPHRHASNRSIYRVDNFVDGDPSGQKHTTSNSPHDTDDSVQKILTKGQAFGEMALLMNYQRTADVRAITYVEMCVLNRSDFQRTLTTHPEDRRKVVSAMLSACMFNNEANGVKCPLANMVRSVYSTNDPTRAAQIRAEEAASFILEVVNSDIDDGSIKFGVNARLRQQLLENRVANTRVVDGIREASTPQSFSTPDTLRVVHTSRSEQPSTPAFTSGDEDNPQSPRISEARIEHSLESLLEMMGEM